MQTSQNAPPTHMGKVIDIMDALRKSLEKVNGAKSFRKPATPEDAVKKTRKRRA